jgi:hypothetical protein
VVSAGGGVGPASDQRLWLIQLLDRLKDGRPADRRRVLFGRARTWFGRSPARFDQVTDCRQCGAWKSVNVIRLSHRRARYWCQHCEALVTVVELGALRRLAEPAVAPPVPTEGPGPQLDHMLPAPMLAWFGDRLARPITVARLDKATIYQMYRQWDEVLAQLAPERLTDLAVTGAAPPLPGLPAFSTVVGELHERCYRTELVVDALRPGLPSPISHVEECRALWERVEHARCWLAARGTSWCWIHARVPDEGLAAPDGKRVEAAAAKLRAGEELTLELARAAKAAMFGTDGGPSLRKLLRVYRAGEMVTALGAYRESGARPLRDDVLARLSAPFRPVSQGSR